MKKIKVLSCFNFLVIVESYDEQQQILGSSPLYMDSKVVVVVPWEIDLNMNPIGVLDVPMWIDLVSVDPMLEVYANYLLGRIGWLVYRATSANLSRFAHIRGCVLLDLEKPFAIQVVVRVLDVEET